jgi:AcrR family transcriptional regulator
LPKVIENIREIILQAAKKDLFAKGYDKLSLRGVCKQCNIAIGTIYNYFPSKINLVAVIMLEDWNKQLEKMLYDCEKAENVEIGIKSVYFNLKDFAMLYQSIWNISIGSKEVIEELAKGRSRHKLLVEQLEEVIYTLLESFKVSKDLFLINFIANSLLVYAMEPNFDYEKLSRIFKKII